MYRRNHPDYSRTFSNTLAVATVNGIVTNTPVTPRVVRRPRHLWLRDLSGGRLENQPTSSGSCYGSHWEQRYFMNEMIVHLESPCGVLAMTLAAMEDSGWYKANYSVATGSGGAIAAVASSPANASMAARRPTAFVTLRANWLHTDHRERLLQLEERLTSIPSQFQHFDGETNKGGQLEVADYCPYVMAYSNGDCSIASNAMSTDYGETYGEASSMCFQNTLVQSGFVASADNYGCYETRCQGGVLEVKVSNT